MDFIGVIRGIFCHCLVFVGIQCSTGLLILIWASGLKKAVISHLQSAPTKNLDLTKLPGSANKKQDFINPTPLNGSHLEWGGPMYTKLPLLVTTKRLFPIDPWYQTSFATKVVKIEILARIEKEVGSKSIELNRRIVRSYKCVLLCYRILINHISSYQFIFIVLRCK